MRVGLVSDTHDREPALSWAVQHFRDRDVAFVLHAGDVTTPQTLERFAAWPGAVAYGNNDDPAALAPVVAALGWQGGHLWVGELDGVKVGLTHGHRRGLLRRLLEDPAVDVVVRGHNHQREDRLVDGKRIVNPGALFRTRTYTAAVWDTDGPLRFVDVPKD